MRGENSFPRQIQTDSGGTSPRARGKHAMLGIAIANIRNIPACAGKTNSPVKGLIRWPEHPRVRGENLPVMVPRKSLRGTSPRARGKHKALAQAGCNNGNIPACAGKTFNCVESSFRGQEHPRVRGENRLSQSGKTICSGTSPRARGKPYANSTPKPKIRNIPACAGKTTTRYSSWRAPRNIPACAGKTRCAAFGDW